MSSKKPNTLLAPLAIAGITIGFLGAAYKFIFVDSKRHPHVSKEKTQDQTPQDPPSKFDKSTE